MRRLAVARRGADVLEEKRLALLREQTRLEALVAERRQRWEEEVGSARTWLQRSLVISGARSLELAAFHVPAAARVSVEWRSALGAVHPSDAQVELPATPDLVAPGGSSALSYAALAHGRAVRAGARYAAARTAYERIAHELRATTRRLRALQRRWIPAHEQALAALELALDEAEREDMVRTRWFAERRVTAPGRSA